MVDDALWQQTAKDVLPTLYKLAFDMLRCQADAQDAVQSALLKAWEKRGGVQPGACRAYLVRTLLNESRDMLRRRKRVVPVDEVPPLPARPNLDADVREALEAISRLPEPLRLAVTLTCLEDMTDQQAAAALGVPVATLRSRLHRARRQLRKALDREVTLG